MRRNFAALLGGLALAGALVAATPVAAADVEPAQVEAFDDGELRSFAAAAVRIFEIQRDFRARIAAGQSPGEQDNLRAEGLALVVAAIEAQGLTSDAYNEIVLAVRTDPALADRIGAYIEELQ